MERCQREAVVRLTPYLRATCGLCNAGEQLFCGCEPARFHIFACQRA